MTGAKFLLHANQFTERGDSVTLMTVAEGLREEFNVDSVIAFPKWSPGNNSARINEAKSRGLEVYQYSSRLGLETLAKNNGLTHNYVVSDGSLAGISYSSGDPENYRIGDLRHLTQAVFRRYEPHGDAYAYISEWLYDWSQSVPAKLFLGPLHRSKGSKLRVHREPVRVGWVPHIVKPEEGDRFAFRRKYLIPSSAKVIGRIGGFDEFSDPGAKRGLLQSLNGNPDYVAILVNTRRFSDHPRIIHCGFLDRREIWDFYAACDVLLNGRIMGESFGFSIVEPLSIGKSVIAPDLARNFRMDQHHISLLKPFNLLYRNASHLSWLIDRELQSQTVSSALTHAVESFGQRRVMQKFKDFYING